MATYLSVLLLVCCFFLPTLVSDSLGLTPHKKNSWDNHSEAPKYWVCSFFIWDYRPTGCYFNSPPCGGRHLSPCRIKQNTLKRRPNASWGPSGGCFIFRYLSPSVAFFSLGHVFSSSSPLAHSITGCILSSLHTVCGYLKCLHALKSHDLFL